MIILLLMFKSLRKYLPLFICVSFLSTSTYWNLSPYDSQTTHTSAEHLAPSRTIETTLVQWVNGVGMGNVSSIDATSKETILFSAGLSLLAAWFLPPLNLAVIDWASLFNLSLFVGVAGLVLGGTIGFIYLIIASVSKLMNSEDNILDLVDPLRLSVFFSYFFASLIYFYFFLIGGMSAGSLESYSLLQLLSFVLGLFIGKKLIDRQTIKQITNTLTAFDEDEIEELDGDDEVIKKIPPQAILKLFSRLEDRLLPILSRWIVLNIDLKSSVFVQILKKGETDAEFNYIVKILNLAKEIGRGSYELDALEVFYAKLKSMVSGGFQREEVDSHLRKNEIRDPDQSKAKKVVSLEVAPMPQMAPHLKQMQIIAFEMTQDPQLNPEENNIFSDSKVFIEFLIKLAEDENLFLRFSGFVEEIEVPVTYTELLTQQIQKYTGGEMPPLMEHFLSRLNPEEEEEDGETSSEVESAEEVNVKLLEEGAVGNGAPLLLSLKEILSIINESKVQNPIPDEYLKEAEEMVISAFNWMMERGAHLGFAPKEHLNRAMSNYIDTQLPDGSDGKKFLYFFKARDFISSNEDYLIGFNRKIHIGLAIDFMFFLKNRFESNLGEEIRIETPDGIRHITLTHELLMALIAEYCFHEFHGEVLPQEEASEEEGKITHQRLYEYVQHDLLRYLFDDKNLLQYFIRQFINKTDLINELEITIGRLSNNYKGEDLKEFMKAFNSLRQTLVLMDPTPILSEAEEELLTYAQRWERVELSSKLSPNKIWEFVQKEIDNPNYFGGHTVESLQYLLGEMIRRLKTQRRSWPRGPLSKDHIGVTLDTFLNQKVIPVLEEFGPKVGKDPETEYWRLVSVLNLHLFNSGAQFLENGEVNVQQLRRTYLRGVNLSKLGLPWEELNGGIDFEGADLRQANLDGLDLQFFKLRGAHLAKAKARGAKILRSQIVNEGLNIEDLDVTDEEPLFIIEDMVEYHLGQRAFSDSALDSAI